MCIKDLLKENQSITHKCWELEHSHESSFNIKTSSINFSFKIILDINSSNKHGKIFKEVHLYHGKISEHSLWQRFLLFVFLLKTPCSLLLLSSASCYGLLVSNDSHPMSINRHSIASVESLKLLTPKFQPIGVSFHSN